MTAQTRQHDPVYGARFQIEDVVTAYHHRPDYPDEVFDTLTKLMSEASNAVLDIGCGLGDIAHKMAKYVGRVDALDISEEMVRQGKASSGGESANLNWIVGAVETALLDPPYGLVTAGDSIHWMDWDVLFPRLAEALVPNGFLALVSRSWGINEEAEIDLIRKYSTMQDYQPIDTPQQLVDRGYLEKHGEKHCKPVTRSFDIEGFIESRHSHQSLSRQHMGVEAATNYDRELAELLTSLYGNEKFDVEVRSRIVWGRPKSKGQS